MKGLYCLLKSIKRYAHYLIILIIRWIVLLLPRNVALFLGVYLADLLFLVFPKEKAKALENLSIAFGSEKSNDEILRICRDCFRNLGKGMMEVLQFPRLNKGNLSNLVIFEGKHNLDDALKLGKGVIILTAHFNNWELLAASLSLSGYPVNAIIRTIRSPYIEKLVTRNRQLMGIRCISRGASIKEALKCLRRNELLVILSDIDTKVDGVFVDFFGRLAFTPLGPVSISMKTGAVIIPTFIIRQEDNSHRIVIERPLELLNTGVSEEDKIVNTGRFTKIIESYIRKNPEQWIWNHQRWRTKPKK
ncbi:lysophospholipid acyltransferase family protein [Candidatus Poribacteria bacterium]|nr:lysophospholipid acyltransferase family protein [Candidatus Poribacteria bacterium]